MGFELHLELRLPLQSHGKAGSLSVVRTLAQHVNTRINLADPTILSLWTIHTMGASSSRTGGRFSGQHVLITGGSEGIGLALAKEFMARSASVTLLARTASKLNGAVVELQGLQSQHPAAAPGTVGSCVADVTQPDQVNPERPGRCMAE